MEKVGWVLLILGALNVAIGPFLIGKKRSPYDPLDWLISLALFLTLYLPVCGRVIGWW